MDKREITESVLEIFREYLKDDEKSEATIKKYMHDIRHFARYAAGKQINKALTLSYKAELEKTYKVTSANSMIAAVNMFLHCRGWQDCCIKQFKVQKRAFCPEDRELTKTEYLRLINTAYNNGNEKLSLIIQTICGTGIRVSELQYITVEAVRKGEAVVNCKAKTRTILIVKALQKNCFVM